MDAKYFGTYTVSRQPRDHSFFMRWGGWWDLRGEACKKIWLQRGGQPEKYGV